MRNFILFAVLTAVSGWVGTANAQEAVPGPLEIGVAGEAYLNAVGRRVDSDVGYFDPTQPPPALQTTQKIEPQEPAAPDRGQEQAHLPTALAAFCVLGAVLFIFWRFSPAVSVSLRPNAANPERIIASLDTGVDAVAGANADLNTILNMANRQKAVMILSHKVLLHVVRTNGLLLQRSWTARDALRNLPGTQDGMEAIKELVLTSERVHFGNYEISQEDLDYFVEKAKAVLKTQPI